MTRRLLTFAAFAALILLMTVEWPEDPATETIRLNEQALAVLRGYRTELQQVIDQDGTVISRGLSDKVCGINIQWLEKHDIKAVCEPMGEQ